MARRHRRVRRLKTRSQVVQIVALGVILAFILIFRTQIGAGAGNFLNAFDTPDVQLPEEREQEAPTAAPDAASATHD